MLLPQPSPALPARPLPACAAPTDAGEGSCCGGAAGGLQDPEPALPVPRAALQARCNCVSTRHRLHQAASGPVSPGDGAPLSERSGLAAHGPRPGRGFLPGCGRIEPGTSTKRGFRPQRRRGEGSGSGGAAPCRPSVPRPRSALGASVHPELPGVVPSRPALTSPHLPQMGMGICGRVISPGAVTLQK